MIYVIKGTEPYLIRKKIAEIIAKSPEAGIKRFNGSDSGFDINEVIQTCESIDLFVNHNIVLVKDAPLLVKKGSESDEKVLLDYCGHPTYESELIFYSLDNSINEKLKVTKELIKNAEFIKLDRLKKYDFFTYAKNMISQSKIKITRSAADYLISNSGFDLSLLAANLKILSLYPDEVDETVLKRLISLPDENDPFNLINALSAKDVGRSLECVNNLLKYDDNILGLISMFANQLRFLYAVAYYDKEGLRDSEIMERLDIRNDYRLQKARESLTHINMKEILGLLSKLSDLDYQCKTNSELDDKTKLELFIVNLIQ